VNAPLNFSQSLSGLIVLAAFSNLSGEPYKWFGTLIELGQPGNGVCGCTAS